MQRHFVWGLVLCLCAQVRAGGEWPQFRGPGGDGHTQAKELPLTWSETEQVAWKTPIHGKAWSSPVIWGNEVWLTTATEDGTQLSVICVDATTGKLLRDQKVFAVEKPQYCHKFNSYASPTPVIEEGRFYANFGAPGTACIDTRTGKVLWERRDFVCNHYRSPGSSPILYQNLLILHFDGSDVQYLVALDKETGKTVWRTDRSIDFKDLGPDGKPMMEGDLRKAFATPHVATIDGVPTLLSMGAKAVYAYEPLSGKEIWRVEERQNHSASTRPLYGLGMVFTPSGWGSGQLLAIRPGKPGEVIDANTESPTADSKTQLAVVWKTKRSVPKKPSLILHNELIFGMEDGGIATCYEARTGKELWRERVPGNYSASLLCASALDRIYCFSEEGTATVLQGGKEFKQLAVNKLESGFMASPAVTGNSLILRTRTHLYRVGK